MVVHALTGTRSRATWRKLLHCKTMFDHYHGINEIIYSEKQLKDIKIHGINEIIYSEKQLKDIKINLTIQQVRK